MHHVMYFKGMQTRDQAIIFESNLADILLYQSFLTTVMVAHLT